MSREWTWAGFFGSAVTAALASAGSYWLRTGKLDMVAPFVALIGILGFVGFIIAVTLAIDAMGNRLLRFLRPATIATIPPEKIEILPPAETQRRP